MKVRYKDLPPHLKALVDKELMSRPAPERKPKKSGSLSDADEQRKFEDMFAFHVAIAKLPIPERQFKIIEGRKFAADFAWPAQRLVVEIQGGIWRKGGGAHSRPGQIVKDIEKMQLAAIAGWFYMPVTTDQVRNGEALRLIEAFMKGKL